HTQRLGCTRVTVAVNRAVGRTLTLKSYETLVLDVFVLPTVIAAAGTGIELYHAIRSLWGTTFGKILLGLFTAPSSFFADLYGRYEIYKMTGENPEVFASARI